MDLNDVYERISEYAGSVVRLCTEKGLRVSTAESCTGGMVSGAVTSVPGSSAVIELGVCSYSNRIKSEILGVLAETLDRYTEYSAQCAEEMALGALRVSGADIAVSTTGQAGPSGGTDEHPIGEVFIGVAVRTGGHEEFLSERFLFEGNREEIRAQACSKALGYLVLKAEAFVK